MNANTNSFQAGRNWASSDRNREERAKLGRAHFGMLAELEASSKRENIISFRDGALSVGKA